MRDSCILSSTFGQNLVSRAVDWILLGQRNKESILRARYLVGTAISACTMMSISEKLKLNGNVVSTMPKKRLDPHISLGHPATNTNLQ